MGHQGFQDPQEELDKLKSPVETFFLTRDRGAGSPTKKRAPPDGFPLGRSQFRSR